MSTLAHVFEAEGLATVALGSMRNQIANTAPPRGLWCDFPLGRPLGVPGDAEFQHRVIAAAFELLSSDEPVFAEFGESIPDEGAEALSCPMPPRHDPDAHPAVDEARGLRPAYDRAIERFGNRAGAGRTVAPTTFRLRSSRSSESPTGRHGRKRAFRGSPARVSQDIRGYYETAALAMVDHAPAAWTGARWFFDHTEAGKTVMAARAAIRDSGAPHGHWFYLAPGDR